MYLAGCLAWAAAITATVAYTPASTTGTDLIAANTIFNLAIREVKKAWTSGYKRANTCDLGSVAIRKEWASLANFEKKSYTDAVLCLMSKPSRINPKDAPGAKTRYDDFVAVHINQTLSIHGTANFLTWHRYFTWSYEQALRNECGYKGYQPYWNWGKSALDPKGSPYLDGSDYSMSGNGDFVPHGETKALPTGLNNIPPGNGGGCVRNGPFKNMKVNLGPVAPTLNATGVVPQQGNGLNYNPRCLRRDISPWVSSTFNKDADSKSLITQNPDIYWFQTKMQGEFDKGAYGVHTGGHFTYQGDPAGDLFTSPGDPMFWLHHAQIDRTYWMWQNQDMDKRLYQISGKVSFLDPNSRNGTLDDIIDMGVLARNVKIRDVMDTSGGTLCYIYL